jgi:2-amino-4-hydroxy-6-hydroxymethyldihydropteridine diphosphokinase
LTQLFLPPNATALIALGTNLPCRWLAGPALLKAALQRLALCGAPSIAVSRFWRTKAWPKPSDPAFTNAVAFVHAGALDPQGMMAVLLQLEAEFGRSRTSVNAPRTLDLDLLDFAGQCVALPDIQLPHPRLHERAFVLGPLCDIAPTWRHPRVGRTAKALWDDLTTQTANSH